MAAPAPILPAEPIGVPWVEVSPAGKYAGPALEPAGPRLGTSDPTPTSDPEGFVEVESSAPSTRDEGDADQERPDEPGLALLPTPADRIGQPPPPSATSSTAAPPPSTDRLWQPPEALYRQLAALAGQAETGDWARRVEAKVRQLGQAVGEPAGPIGALCDELERLVEQAAPLAQQAASRPQAAELRRAAYALRRRLDVWRLVLPADAAATSPAAASAGEPDPQGLALAVGAVGALAGDSAEGRAWREYLSLEVLRNLPAPTDADRVAVRRAAARDVLWRVAHAPLDPSQRRFLQSAPLVELGTRLCREAAGPMDRAKLLREVEQYEQSGRPSDAERLAEQCLWLGMAQADARQEVARRLSTHYRNANVRIALTAELVNRFMPERPAEYAPVRDFILGRPVRGESLTATSVAVRLIPDPRRLLLALEITGEVAALTSSTSGPATFHNASESWYVARKPIEITTGGLVLGPAEVDDVENVTRLRGLRTDFDGIPLVGALVHGMARSQHDSKRPELRREVTQKVASRAKQRIDEEADQRLGDLSERLNRRLIEPLAEMALGPTMIEASTTEDRLVMRLRLASRRQLGAHTPRPRAPGDSLASVQIHQTALNNVVERLELGGKTLSLPQLRERIAQQLGRPELAEGSPENDDVTITFAKRDAVRVECEDGRLAIALSVVELTKPPRSWYDFQVRVYYRPEIEGMSVVLVRDGVVQLTGEYMSTSAQVALRSVFSKIFSKNRSRQIIPERIRNEPRMADLAVTQMAVQDGWIALAIGPARQIARSAGPKARRGL